jgi:oxygen-independent coproporphyrinogen-3 oxidase
VTSEANPGTVDQQSFATLRSLGINRLSLGVQSLQAEELAFLGRIHGVGDVGRAFRAARQAGFDEIKLDFIFGLPNQQPALWEATLAGALALGPEHLSLYSLIVEENTPLYNWVETGRVAPTDDDLAATLYEGAMARLADAGYAQYEVSNWARLAPHEPSTVLRPAHLSRHNRVYWRNGEYVGIGPGAHSHLRLRDADGRIWSRRWSNRKPVAGYVRRIQQGASVEAFSELLGERTAMGETMMVGLRLTREGVSFAHFERLHGADLRTIFATELAELTALGLLERDAARIRLTARGLLLGNQVFAQFLAEAPAALSV